ncbi:ribonuclease H-like domain-containing protein [Chytridium lagenaria]|nr:ribonuclease H-like domain-containing protein [Chytridium lagenaria]
MFSSTRLASIPCAASSECPYGSTCWFSHTIVASIPKRKLEDTKTQKPRPVKQLKTTAKPRPAPQPLSNLEPDHQSYHQDNDTYSPDTTKPIQLMRPLPKPVERPPEKPSVSRLSGKPIVLPDLHSKVPRDKRQKVIDHFYNEYLRIFKPLARQQLELARDHAIRQEKSLLERATGLTYITLASPTLNRLKKRPVAKDINDVGIDGEWKEWKPIQKALQSTTTVEPTPLDAFKVLCIPEPRLIALGFNLIPSHPPPPQRNDRTSVPCDRCQMEFTPKLFLGAEDKEACKYHKYYARTRIQSQIENVRKRTFMCCGLPIGAVGCCVGPHVFKEADFDALNRKIPFTVLPDIAPEEKGVVACDCEMSYTSGGMELTRVTVIDLAGNLLLDELVKTTFPIIDFNTEWSGITTLDNAVHDLVSIKKKLATLISKSTIIIGHGLENDLNALRISHTAVIDTAALFPVRAPSISDKMPRHSLKHLAEKLLNRSIQTGASGHDPKEDAQTALDLVKLYIENKNKDFVY